MLKGFKRFQDNQIGTIREPSISQEKQVGMSTFTVLFCISPPVQMCCSMPAAAVKVPSSSAQCGLLLSVWFIFLTIVERFALINLNQARGIEPNRERNLHQSCINPSGNFLYSINSLFGANSRRIQTHCDQTGGEIQANFSSRADLFCLAYFFSDLSFAAKNSAENEKVNEQINYKPLNSIGR